MRSGSKGCGCCDTPVPDWLSRRKDRTPALAVPTPPPEPGGYAGFKVVPMTQTLNPGLGFGDYAASLAEMTLHSSLMPRLRTRFG